jgi:hypothetical protein
MLQSLLSSSHPVQVPRSLETTFTGGALCSISHTDFSVLQATIVTSLLLKQVQIFTRASVTLIHPLAPTFPFETFHIHSKTSCYTSIPVSVQVRTFTEAEIRASVVFQLSKLCSLLLKALREVVGGGGWDALVSGSAVGTLFSIDRIEPGALTSKAGGGPLILLVKEASGDEEVKAASEDVRGVVLCQVRKRSRSSLCFFFCLIL